MNQRSFPPSPYPLPQPIYGSEPNSWANSTVTIRLPEIGRRVLTNNNFPKHIQGRINELIHEIPEGPIRLLRDRAAPDFDQWNETIAAYEGSTWFGVPWFFVEHYFYRRLLEATEYFRSDSLTSQDPFAYEKQKGLDKAIGRLEIFAEDIVEFAKSSKLATEFLHRAVELSLWGNQVDLSLRPADSAGLAPMVTREVPINSILVDDRPALLEHMNLWKERLREVGWVADNAGFELGLDLIVIARILEADLVERCSLMVKPHPTFVSDATEADVRATIVRFQESLLGNLSDMGNHLEGYLHSGRLEISSDYFWTSPLAGWDLPHQIYSKFEGLGLVVVKGDMNYRRLLGDRHWDYSTPFSAIVEYFPAPLLALRVLKAELASGIPADLEKKLVQLDPKWTTSGQWGTIQYFVPTSRQ